MFEIKGWVRSSLIDYPGRIAAVLFTGGCNFRCPMCHNHDLVEHAPSLPSLNLDEVLDFLARRTGRLTGVVISGGEPTLQPGLPEFLMRVRALGYAVKLDTNGYRPDVLTRLLSDRLLDAVAMDVKAPAAKYALLTGLRSIDSSLIAESMACIATSPVQCEFRTTVVPGLLEADDIEAIARWIAEVRPRPGSRYVLQQFRGGQTLDPRLEHASPYPTPVLERMAMRAREWVEDVRIRGV